MATKARKIGHVIPKVDWWCVRATTLADASGLSRKELAAAVTKMGFRTTDASVVRCLSGEVLTLEVARHLSTLLGIPPPILVPASEEDAWRLLGQQEAQRARERVRQLGAKLDEEGNRKAEVSTTEVDEPRPRRR